MIVRRIHSFGFSLVEVNLAVALIALGMLTLFSLFPMGLRESEMSIVDTHEATFANHVLSCIEANAMDIINWSDWANLNTCADLLVKDIFPAVSAGKTTEAVPGIGTAVVFGITGMGSTYVYPLIPPNEKNPPRILRYKIKIIPTESGPARRRVEVWVKSGKYGEFNANCSIYFTDVMYSGM